MVNIHFKGAATKYLNNYVVWHNLVNFAKGSEAEKEGGHAGLRLHHRMRVDMGEEQGAGGYSCFFCRLSHPSTSSQ